MTRDTVTAWTRQNCAILGVLSSRGRYTVRESYITDKFDDMAPGVLELYRFLAREREKKLSRPRDVTYPIWLTLNGTTRMRAFEGEPVLVLEIPEERIVPIDNQKWEQMINFRYIPADEEDRRNHRTVLQRFSLHDDSQAYMSHFYPHLKRKIQSSWRRIFDDSVRMGGSGEAVGSFDALCWEIEQAWVHEVIHSE